MLGRLFEGKYRVTRLIGEGGMGVVYEAEHTLIGRPVALKLLHGDFAKNPDALERFHREARAATAIRHPNIIEITDMGTTPEGQPFLVLELLDGVPLTGLLRPGAPLTAARLRDIITQVLDALDAAHAKGIVHRDLKPDNVFVLQHPNRPDFVKLLDFGVSKLTGEALGADISTTRTGTLMGTPSYMSPEQARGRKDIDHRVDLWACGVMIYEAVCGRLPYLGDNYNELLSSILLEDPPAPRTLNPGLGEPLARFLERALAKDRDKRFGSAAEMRAAFVAATADPDAAIAPPPPAAPPPPGQPTEQELAPTIRHPTVEDTEPAPRPAAPTPEARAPAATEPPSPPEVRPLFRRPAVLAAAAAALVAAVVLAVSLSGERTSGSTPAAPAAPDAVLAAADAGPPAPDATAAAPARDAARPAPPRDAAPATTTDATATADAAATADTSSTADASTPATPAADGGRRPPPGRDVARDQAPPPPALPVCGDGRCEAAEGCATCASDCAAPESCNGLDDDCDTALDEDFGIGQPCDGADDDRCTDGTTVCDGPTAARCDEPPDSAVELCNGSDDDCDGSIDEDFDLLRDPSHCGACDAACHPSVPDCCGGACVDLREDEVHCGECGRTCAAPGEGCCAGVCVDLRGAANCGSCGKDCAALGLCCGVVEPPDGYGCVDC